MPVVNRSYALLASNRSGSTLLCHLLSKTGVAGKPGEYFGMWESSPYQLLGGGDYRAYLQQIIAERTTSNGVFGVKVMGGDLNAFNQQLETFPEGVGRSLPEKIRAFFPNMRFIYLTRRNKVAQAVSWWKSAQNGHYHTTDETPAPRYDLRYDVDAITHLIHEIALTESGYQAFLDSMGVTPLTLVYEDCVQDLPATLQRIVDYLEITEPATYHEPDLRPMADAVSAQWIHRYQEQVQSDWAHRR